MIMISVKDVTVHTIIIKKSEFVTHLIPCSDVDKAKELIEHYSDPEATHNCVAYIIGPYERANDDGEPSQTAGMPMLNVLKMQGLTNIIAIVTRYFGGIKLGAGGLVRAYSKSVMEAIGEAEIVEIEEYDVYELVFEYSDIKIADSEVRNNSLETIDKDYSDKVHYQVVSKDNRDIEKIFEKYLGKISVNFKNKQFLEKI
jgi:uncharacterized YigZ family protein